MKQYRYRGRTKEGKKVQGRMKHPNKEQLIQYLKQQGIWIFYIKEQHPIWAYFDEWSSSQKLSQKELSVFFFQLASMLSIGITVLDALGTLQNQMKSKKAQQGIMETYVLVQQGYNLSAAMGLQGQFPVFAVRSIEAGEKGGSLEYVMKKLGQHYEEVEQMTSQLKKTLTYPIFVFVTMIAVFTGFVYFLFPIFSDLLYSMVDEIPPFTLIVLRGIKFIQQRGWIFLIGLLLFIVFVLLYKQTVRGRNIWGYMLLHFPVLGPFMIQWFVIQFSRTLGLLLGSGIPLLLALEQVVPIIRNSYLEEKLTETIQTIRTGSFLSQELERHALFPRDFVQMVALGEETGDLEGIMNKVCLLYEQNTRMSFQRGMAFLEPTLILFVAVMVSGMLFTMMYPLLQVVNTIGGAL